MWGQAGWLVWSGDEGDSFQVGQSSWELRREMLENLKTEEEKKQNHELRSNLRQKHNSKKH